MDMCRWFEKPPTEKGQAFMEFALALPIILLLLIGTMEVGRLMFTYAATHTAAREASRFAATTGRGSNDAPHYADCAGIQEIANSFFIPFDLVEIRYDRGPEDIRSWDELPACPHEARMGERVIVRTSTEFRLPFLPGEPIILESTAARTILRDVELGDETWP